MRSILSRRAFLGGIAAGATSAILAACGGSTAATSTPGTTPTTAATGGATAPTGALSNIATQVADRLTPAAATPTTIAPTAAVTAAPSVTAIPTARVAVTSTPSGTAGMVYALTNQEADNQVAIFSRRADGKLTFERAVSTGGKGIGEQQDGEGLGSQGAALLGPDGKFLFVCNGGSKDISVFSTQETNLSMIQKIPSNGPRPISLTMHGATLYALNFSRQQPGNGNITAFTVGGDGKLTPLANSTKPLSSNGNVDPGQVRFNPKGDLLVVTEKATNKLVSYTVGANGIASAPTAFASGGEAPFSFAFVNDTLLVTADNFGDAQNKGAASSFSIGDKGSLKLVSKAVPDKQTGACWITVSKDGTYAWVVNTGAATVSGYQIDPSGKLTLLNADGITARAGAKRHVVEPATRYVRYHRAGGGEAARHRAERRREIPLCAQFQRGNGRGVHGADERQTGVARRGGEVPRARRYRPRRPLIAIMLTLFGAVAVTVMMVSYALERRSAWWLLVFAVACTASSAYGWLAGAWPFGVVEGVWALVALRRWWTARGHS